MPNSNLCLDLYPCLNNLSDTAIDANCKTSKYLKHI